MPNEAVETAGDRVREIARPLVVHPTGARVPREQHQQGEPFGVPRRRKVHRELPIDRVSPWIPLEHATMVAVVLDRPSHRHWESSLAPRLDGDAPGHRAPHGRENTSGSIRGGSSLVSAMPRSPLRSRGSAVPVEGAFAVIRADRRHGAHALALAALDVLGGRLEQWSRPGGRPGRATVRRVARSLELAQPAMGPFLRWAAEWRRLERTTTPEGFARTAGVWVRREMHRLQEEEARLARTARRRFPLRARRVVTISRSRSVLAALSALPPSRRPALVSVLESQPGGEGRLFAGDLRRVGLRARTIPDAAGIRAVRAADLVLLGADAVFANGSVAHKVGTRRLAEAAVGAGIPVVVVAGESKFTGRPPPRRLLPVRFDRTPGRYVSEFWTDRGVRPGGRARRLAHRRSPL